ncbi:Ribonuclease T(2) [Bertholletia excelsa]
MVGEERGKESAMARLFAQTTVYIQILALLIATSCLLDIRGGVAEARKQREFDYFALALQWPGTYCQRTSHCCSSNACCRGSNAPTEFTIHGLWPDYNDGSWPACCTRSNFDLKEISTLRDALEKYWPSLSCGSPSTCHGGKGIFWAHEVII